MIIISGTLTRWNDASLDTSICDLFRTHPMANAYGSTPEMDDNKALPRAEFSISNDEPNDHAVGYTLRTSMLKFNVWHSNDVSLETALDLIESTYDNSQKASTNPFVATSGSVIRVQFAGRESGPVDENVYLGTVEFEVEWQKTFSVPA